MQRRDFFGALAALGLARFAKPAAAEPVREITIPVDTVDQPGQPFATTGYLHIVNADPPTDSISGNVIIVGNSGGMVWQHALPPAPWTYTAGPSR